MKRWIPLTFITLAASIGFAPLGYAQPRPGDRPGDHPGDKPGDHPGDHPGDKPGEHGPAASEFAAKLQKLEDDQRKKRDEERKDAKRWDADRDQRAAERRRQLEGVWGAPFLARPETRAELDVHAERIARIERIIDIAADTHNAALMAHAQRVLAAENQHHARVMAELRIRLGVQ
jgi:hypothetical protein